MRKKKNSDDVFRSNFKRFDDPQLVRELARMFEDIDEAKKALKGKRDEATRGTDDGSGATGPVADG